MHPSIQRRGELAGETVAQRYQILDVRGRDGCVQACRARDLMTGRDVSLLCLIKALAPCPRSLEKFRHDIALLQGVSAPGVGAPLDSGEEGGLLYVALEIPGGTLLSEVIARRHAVDPAQLLTALAAALAAVHERGIVHLDVRPSRVLVPASGVFKLLSFDTERDVRQLRLTEPGGRWLWAAPEHLLGMESGPSADVYSAAAIVYTVLAGEPPHARASLADRCLGAVPALPSNCTGVLGDILRQCLQPDAGSRFQNGAALLQACSMLRQPAAAEPSLESLLRDDPQDSAVVVSSLLGACSVLRAIHDAGKSHRSPSPSNILIDARGGVRIHAGEPPPPNATVMVENPKYAPPELLVSKVTSGSGGHVAADIYVLGFGAYELLVGRGQFGAQFASMGEDRSNLAWMAWHADPSKRLPPVRELAPAAPASLCAMIDRMVQKDPAARPKSLEEVETGLRQLETRLEETGELDVAAIAGRPSAAPARRARRRRRWPLVVLTALAVLASLAYAAHVMGWLPVRAIADRLRTLLG